jgi:hypothetical protein
MVELFGHIRMIHERDKPRVALEAGFPKFVSQFTGDADAFISNVLEPLADAWLMLTDTVRVQKHFGSEAAKAVKIAAVSVETNRACGLVDDVPAREASRNPC